MPTDTARAAGPSLEQFAGARPAQVAHRLFNATRPKFFPASLLPVLAGTAWGCAVSGSFEVAVFALAVLATVSVHAGANVLNDVGDDLVGTDRLNEDRIYPYTGGSQFIQAGIMSASAMTRLGVGLLLVAVVAGAALLALRGWTILWFGLAGIALAVLYSLGPLRLNSSGLGEFAVGVAFGVLPVTGAAWLQSGVIDTYSVLFSLPVASWVAAILLINEVPDLKADSATGKRTLPVRVGLNGTAAIYLALQLSASIAVVALAAISILPAVAPVVPLVLLIPAWKAASAIRRGIDERADMTRAIESTLLIHTAGTLWLGGAALFIALTGNG